MRLELMLRLDAPLGRELCDREVRGLLQDLRQHGPDLEGTVGSRARVRTRPHFATGSNGVMDRTIVAHVELALEFDDEEDVGAFVEACFTLSAALRGPLCSIDGLTLDREHLLEVLREMTHERRRQRRVGHVEALVGAALIVTGGGLVHGFDVPDVFGVMGLRHHVHFVGLGVTFVTAGSLVVAGSLMPWYRS